MTNSQPDSTGQERQRESPDLADGSRPAETEETPLAYRVVRGGLWVAASSYFNVGFGFLASLFLTRILTPEDFGVFVLAGFFFSLINVRPKIAVGQALAQSRDTSGEMIGSHLALDFSAGIISLVIAAVAVPVLRLFGYAESITWVLLAFAAVGVSDSIMGTAWVLLDKELRLSRTSIVTSLSFPVSYVPAFWLALHGGGYWSLIAQNACYAALLLLAMWWTARISLPAIWRFRWRVDRAAATKLLRFGSVVGVAGIAGMLVGQFDNFLVGTFVGVAMLGFYDRAYKIAQWPTLLVTSVVSRAAFYTYARLQDDHARLSKTVTMSLWIITILALPLAIGIFIAAPDLISWLYGERWMQSVIFLRFLVIYSVIRPVLDDAGSLFVAVGRPRLTAIVASSEAGILIAAGLPLTLRFGAVGTCFAVGAAFMLGLFITYRSVVRLVAIKLWETLGLPGLAASITVGGYALLIRVVNLGNFPLPLRAISEVLFASSVYLGVLFVLQPRSMIERSAYVWRLVRARSMIREPAG